MSRISATVAALAIGLCASRMAPGQGEPATAPEVPARVQKAIADYEETAADPGKAAMRNRALIWLGEIDEPSVTDYLKKELAAAGDKAFAAVVLEAIAKVPRPALKGEVDAILHRKQAPVSVRNAAAVAVASLGEHGIDRLLELARGDDDATDAVRDAATRALIDCGHERALRDLAPLLLEGPMPARAKLLRRMDTVHGVPPVSAARIELVTDGNLEVAALAWRQLAQEKHERAKALTVDVLERIFDVPAPGVAADLIAGLVLVREADFYPLLLRFGSIPGAVVQNALRAAAADAARDRALIDWLVTTGLESAQPAAREAAKLLLQEAPPDAIAPLVAKVRKELRRGKGRSLDLAVGMHELLAKDPSWQDDLLGLLASNDTENRIVGFSLLIDLGSPVGISLAQQSLAHKAWQLRSVAIRYLTRFRDTSSIPLLIARFEREDGRLASELDQALFVHTGTRCWRRKEWEAWWAKNSVGFVLPHAETVRTTVSAGGGRTISYYDIPLVSTRVAFLVDTSGSMLAPMGTDKKRSRLDVAKEQLTSVLGDMPNDHRCNVIPYSGDVKPIWDQLRRLSEDNKKEILSKVNKLAAAGGTNIFDAIEFALADADVDTIYLLTDGQPTAGRLKATEDILDEVRRQNRSRQVVIHCIAVGLDSDLLKRLAADSGGAYKSVK
ncbi:MAG TPA: VWA domain-containing protein [Planctomycetota bacterium]|nr:VWA domain-containing protein [Planctomycetota bacterium]